MAQFADYQKPDQSPNYLGMSKEIDVPKIDNNIATTVRNVGQLGINAIGAVDEMNKDTIDKQLLAGINERRQEDIQTGMDVLSGNTSSVPQNPDGSPNVPTAVEQGLRRAAHITQAKKMGKMADELYYGDMQGIAQGLITRYPPYERYIQDRMTHWLGTNAANAQRAAILATLRENFAEKNSELNKWTNFVRQNSEWFSDSNGQFNAAMFTKAQNAFGNPKDMAEIESYVAKQQSHAKNLAVSNAELERLMKINAAGEADALKAYRAGVTSIFNDTTTKQSFTVAGMNFSNWKDIEEQMSMIKNSGGKVDQQFLVPFAQAIGQYHNAAEARMRDLARDPKFMSLVQDPSKLEAIRNELLGNFKNMQAEVGAGNIRVGSMFMNTFEGMSNYDALKAIGEPALRRWNQYRQVAGPGASILLERELPLNQRMPTEVTERLKNINLLDIISGGRVSLDTMTQQYNQVHGITGPLTPQQTAERVQYYNAAIDFAQRIVSNQEAPVSTRENAAMFIASTGNTSFLLKLPAEQQMNAWAKLADPRIAASVKSSVSPAQWREYTTWAQESFKSLMNAQISQINRGMDTAANLSLYLDDNNNLQFNTSGRDPGSLGQSRPGGVPAGINQATIKSIQDINFGLDTYASILKLNGKKLDDRELAILGLKVQRPETGGTSGTSGGNKRTSEAPNGSEGLSMVSFITPANAQNGQIPPSDRVREGFRSIANMENDNPSRFIYDDAGVGQQLRERAQQGFPQPRR